MFVIRATLYGVHGSRSYTPNLACQGHASTREVLCLGGWHMIDFRCSCSLLPVLLLSSTVLVTVASAVEF